MADPAKCPAGHTASASSEAQSEDPKLSWAPGTSSTLDHLTRKPRQSAQAESTKGFEVVVWRLGSGRNLAWWTFRIFFIFFCSGRGKGESRRQGGGSVFY